MVTICFSGCATKALWEENRFARFHEPSVPPNFELFDGSDGKRALVFYNETRDTDAQKSRKAYWVSADVEPQSNPDKPKFVPLRATEKLQPLSTNVVAPLGLSAIPSTNGQSFTLYSNGKELWRYELPVYEDSSGPAKRVALTPLAVVCDLTIVGGYLFLLFHGWPLVR
jgi:hypothetical protein